MNSNATTPVIAIDGGGTKCRLAISDANESSIVEVGSANVSTDLRAAVAELLRGIDALVGSSGIPREELIQLPTYMGLAGVTGDEISSRLSNALPFGKMRIEDDRPAALRGAFGESNGILLHCGTGSFAASQLDGVMRFVGGWGPVLGDEASAQWVGRRALASALLTQDHFVETSELSEHLFERFGSAADIVAFAGQASPADFGLIAQDVTHYANRGDAIGQSIMLAAANQLAETCVHLNWSTGTQICLTGGIGPQFADYLPGNLRAALSPARGTPLDGAIALAAEYSQELIDECR